MAESYFSHLAHEDVSQAMVKRERKRKVASAEDELKNRKTKLENEQSLYSDFSYRMMANMGYKAGKGLGKADQGIVEPVESSKQKGRRGLGLSLDKLEREDVKWEDEEVDCDQSPDWIPKYNTIPLTEEDLPVRLRIGKKKFTIEDETNFCDSRILKRILGAKEIFDHLDRKEFLEARLRSNPFETIKGVFFQNRAAMKMANIDAVFDYNFTYPKTSDGQPAVVGTELLYFADICAGPGGFSEYVLWRRKWHAKGFGLTLKDPTNGFDFKLDEFFAAPSETFEPYYGVGGIKGDGDITRLDNITAFREYVMEHTGHMGVHFVMGDGGISVEGEENIQELLTKQLVLCQFLCALSILRCGGNFVCKTFDLYTTFNVGLIYLLYRCFEKVCIFKPVTSRPANSERYVVCLNKISYTDPVYDHLFNINKRLNELKKKNVGELQEEQEDVLEVVPLSMINNDQDFVDYMIDSNNSLGLVQAIALKKIQYFVKNPNLLEMRQTSIRETCLKLWKIPDQVRAAPQKPMASTFFEETWKSLQDTAKHAAPHSILNSAMFTSLTKEAMCRIKDVHSWRFYFACGMRLLLVGLGRHSVFSWEMKPPCTFMSSRTNINLQLPAGTILEVELVDELIGQGGGQRRCHVLYIVDVISIHNELIGDKPFKERFAAAEKLAKAVNKPSIPGSVLLKMKPWYKLFDIEKELSKLRLKKCKGFPFPVPTYQVSDDNKSVAPKGIVLFRIFRDPWEMHWSQSNAAWYYFNKKTQQSTYECPPSSVASYISFVKSRHFWLWTKSIFAELCGERISEADSTALEEGLDITRDFMRTYVKSSLHPIAL